MTLTPKYLLSQLKLIHCRDNVPFPYNVSINKIVKIRNK